MLRIKNLTKNISFIVLLCTSITEFSIALPGNHEEKASYIYQFAKSTSWPYESRAITIAVIKDPKVAKEMYKYVKKKINDKDVVLVELSNVEDFNGRTDITFFGDMPDEKIQPFLDKIGTSPSLTIGQTDSFLKLGGMVELFKYSYRVRFRLDEEKSSEKGLVIGRTMTNFAVQ